MLRELEAPTMSPAVQTARPGAFLRSFFACEEMLPVICSKAVHVDATTVIPGINAKDKQVHAGGMQMSATRSRMINVSPQYSK